MNKLPQGIILQQAGDIIYMNNAVTSILCIERENGLETAEGITQVQPEPKITEISVAAALETMRRVSSGNSSLFDFLSVGKDLKENEQKMMCFQYKDRSGRERKLTAEIKRMTYDSKDCVALIIEDLTNSMQLERQMLNKKFEKMLIASFSHELITPLNGIMGLLEIIEDQPRTASVGRLTETAKSTCNMLLYLINDITELAKEQPRMEAEVARDRINVRNMISECVNLVSFGFAKKKIELNVDIDSDVPVTICTDNIKYRQILLHLLGNALKYTMEGGVTIKVRYNAERFMLMTSVNDTGIGISTEDMASLFQLFGKLDQTSSINPQGAGLGLTICQRYTKLLRGTLDIKSELGKGTTFTLSIPMDPGSTEFVLSIEPTRELDEEQKCMTDDKIDEPVINSAGRYSFFKGRALVATKFSSNILIKSKTCKTLKCKCNKYLIVDDYELNRFAIQGLLKRIGETADEVFRLHHVFL